MGIKFWEGYDPYFSKSHYGERTVKTKIEVAK